MVVSICYNVFIKYDVVIIFCSILKKYLIFKNLAYKCLRNIMFILLYYKVSNSYHSENIFLLFICLIPLFLNSVSLLIFYHISRTDRVLWYL